MICALVYTLVLIDANFGALKSISRKSISRIVNVLLTLLLMYVPMYFYMRSIQSVMLETHSF